MGSHTLDLRRIRLEENGCLDILFVWVFLTGSGSEFDGLTALGLSTRGDEVEDGYQLS